MDEWINQVLEHVMEHLLLFRESPEITRCKVQIEFTVSEQPQQRGHEFIQYLDVFFRTQVPRRQTILINREIDELGLD